MITLTLALGLGCTDQQITESTADVGSPLEHLSAAAPGTVDRVTITPTDTLRIGPVGGTGTFLARAWVGNQEVATPIKWWIRQKDVASLPSTECISPCEMTVKGVKVGTAYLDARDYNGGDSPPRDNAIIKVTATGPTPDDGAPPPDTDLPDAEAGTVDRVTITPTDTLRIGPVGGTATFRARAWAGNKEVATKIKWWIRQKDVASLSSTECTSPCEMSVKGLKVGTAYLDARDYNGGNSPARDNAIIKVTASAPPPSGDPEPTPPDSTPSEPEEPTPPPPPPPPPSDGSVRAFPGAVGFGTETRAGRGGQIVRVTNLNDSGAGSLRAALAVSGPKVIVFEVSGTITLNSDLEINTPYTTVAGQTAPSPGITLRRAGFFVETHDVLVQHIRVRLGNEGSTEDATRIYGGSREVYNVVFDHVSASWAVDENCGTSTAGVRRDITILNSIISEGLADAGHGEGEHSKGCLFGEGSQRIALIGSLLAHNKDRNPRFKAGTSGVVVNNVIYNWGSGSSNGTLIDGSDGSAASSHAAVGNSYIPGVNSGSTTRPIKIASSVASGTRVFVLDNRFRRQNPPSDPWALVENEGGSVRVTSAPVWPAGLQAMSSGSVESYVLARAGARPGDRDAVDARIVQEVRNGTGSIIDLPSERGGWPTLAQNRRTFQAPANPNGDDDGDGYTNLDAVLYQMAAQVEGR